MNGQEERVVQEVIAQQYSLSFFEEKILSLRADLSSITSMRGSVHQRVKYRGSDGTSESKVQG